MDYIAQVVTLQLGHGNREGPDLRFGGGGGYVAAVTGSDGNVYCPPFSATRVLRISDWAPGYHDHV